MHYLQQSLNDFCTKQSARMAGDNWPTSLIFSKGQMTGTKFDFYLTMK